MLLILCVALFFFPLTVAADEPLGAGLAVREEYNDNVFLTADREKSDTATTVEPSLSLFWTRREHSLKLGYNSSLLFYNGNSSQNRSVHAGVAEGHFSLPAKSSLKLLVRNSYDFFQRDIRQSEATQNRVEGNDLTLNPSFTFGLLEPIYFTAGYLYQRRDYRHSEDGVEWRSQGLNLALGVNLMPKIDVSLTYRQADKEFFPVSSSSAGTSDFEDRAAGLSIKSNAFDKLAGEVTYNRLWRETKSGNDHETNIMTAKLTFKPLDKLSIEPGYSQNLYERVDGKFVEQTQWEIMLVQQLAQWGNLRYGIFGYRESYLNNTRTDKSLGGKASLSIAALTRILITLGGSYEHFRSYNDDVFSEADRSTINAMVSYNFKDWASFFLSYNRAVSVAKGNINEYENNRYAVGLRFTY